MSRSRAGRTALTAAASPRYGLPGTSQMPSKPARSRGPSSCAVDNQ
ncbi:hypothetical protein ACN24L_38020 [Streptomyces microflavus]